MGGGDTGRKASKPKLNPPRGQYGYFLEHLIACA